MSWTTNSQARLDRLREKELSGTLTQTEQTELAGLIAQVEAEEAEALAPALDRLRAEVGQTEEELSTLQEQSEELARLLAQQQSLAADARRFLEQFEQRRASILHALARVGPPPLLPG